MLKVQRYSQKCFLKDISGTGSFSNNLLSVRIVAS